MWTTWRELGRGSFWKLETLFLLAVAALSVVFMVGALGMRRQTGLFPGLMGLLTLVLSVANLGVRAAGASAARSAGAGVRERSVSGADPTEGGVPGQISAGPHVHWYTFAAAFMLYVAAVAVVGFILSTALFCMLLPMVMGIRSFWRAGAFAIVTTAIVTVLFREVFMIRLPDGILWAWIIGG